MVRDIPFDQIPQQSALFLSYLALSPRALTYYQQQPPTLDSLCRRARAGWPVTFPRKETAAILRRQNDAFGGGERTRQHIADLESTDAVAILTGQQVGLFTGPLYTIYKAMTAIRIAEELRSRDIKAIPIFWMDSEDHDLTEVTHVRSLGPYPPGRTMDFKSLFLPEAENSSRSVGTIEFPETIVRAVEEYISFLPQHAESAETRALLESACRPGVTFSQSFAEIMHKVLGSYGLVLFDPLDAEAKGLVRSIFHRAILGAGTISSALEERTRELESADFHAQVSLPENSTVLFLREDRDRKPLIRTDDGFAVKNSSAQFTLDELTQLMETAPDRFSPNVLLRPIVQDFLFPTIAYVGGPAEVAYFAQVEVLYRFFERPMPIIWPRASFTLLEPEVAQSMTRHGIEMTDIFQGQHHLTEKLLQALNHESSSLILVRLRENLDRGFADIKDDVLAIDASLEAALENAQRKIFHNVDSLQAKVVKLESNKDLAILHEVKLLLDSCYPEMHPQEREISVHPFLARHGAALPATLYALVRPSEFIHRLVVLTENRA